MTKNTSSSNAKGILNIIQYKTPATYVTARYRPVSTRKLKPIKPNKANKIPLINNLSKENIKKKNILKGLGTKYQWHRPPQR